MSRPLYIKQAVYISGYAVEIEFSDGTIKKVDFENFLKDHSHPQYNKYRNPSNFKKFYIDHGNIVWGKNWDLIFPVEHLYAGNKLWG